MSHESLPPPERLRRQWAAAFDAGDPQRVLARLREVCMELAQRPDLAAPMWIDFLRSVVGQPFQPLLVEADFARLEGIALLVAEAGGIPLDQAVEPLAVARFGRGEGWQANELLTRVYWARSVQDPARAALADVLARSGQRDVPRVQIYADLLGRAGLRPPAVVALAADVLRVDFSSDQTQLWQAAALAVPGLDGADRAAGLYRLIVTAELGAARDCFAAACAADPRDATALLGLIATYVRAGSAASIPTWALEAARESTPSVAAMAELGRVLAWFDSDVDSPAPPSAWLEALDVSQEAGPWLAYAQGRLHLLAGNAARARDLLVPLAECDSSFPQWRYHAAWSQQLCGDRAAARPRGGDGTGRPEDWALACLLRDAEPDAPPGTDGDLAAPQAPPGYERIAQTRSDLAAGRRPPDSPDRPAPRPAGSGGGPERLEALRTAMAEALGLAGTGELAALLREPLYRRLPRADRFMWEGLLALREDPADGQRLLEDALTLGQQRAALALAAHHLAQCRPAAAYPLLAGRSDPKAELLSRRAVLADVLAGRQPGTPPPDGAGEQAALLRVVHAAALVQSDPGRCLDLLLAAAQDCDLVAVCDLPRLLPALLARHTGKPGGASREPGNAHPLARNVKRLIEDRASGVGPAILTGYATAVGEYELADELWSLVCRERLDSDQAREHYAQLLCHQAGIARKAGNPVRSAKLLRQVAALQPAAGPALARVPSRRRAESLARDLELDVYVGRLLDQLFPGAEALGAERPGRYAALETAVESDPALFRALETGEPGEIARSWTDYLGTREYDPRLHHTLAVLYRSMALRDPLPTARAGGQLARATALWTLLLCSGEFWEQHGETPARPDAETRLRDTVCRELFGLHRKRGAEALQAGERDIARLHLQILDATGKGESALRSLLPDFGIPWSPPVDQQRWAQIARLAGSATDEWCAEVIQTGEKAITDPSAIAELAEGIDKDYESGIRELEPLIGLGIPVLRLLTTALGWHNKLLNCHDQMRRRNDVRKVAEKARTFADALIPLCAPGQGHLPGNKVLAEHFVDRGLFLAPDTRTAIKSYEASMTWNAVDPNAPRLLARARITLTMDTLKLASQHLDANRPDLALHELRPFAADADLGARVRQTMCRAQLDRAAAALDAKDHRRVGTAAREAHRLAEDDKERAQALTYLRLAPQLAATRDRKGEV